MPQRDILNPHCMPIPTTPKSMDTSTIIHGYSWNWLYP
jgi:hypothetical protein